MKKILFLFIISFLSFSCGSKSNDDAFVNSYSGRYLFNSDEVIEVYFENNELFLKWRGAHNIKPLKVDENTFFVKEMNEKIQFQTNQTGDHSMTLIAKDNNSINVSYNKLKEGEKIPSEYLKNNQFDKALEAYLVLKQNDSLDPAINEGDLNSVGYDYLRDKEFEHSINVFKINAALYPESSNVYDSLAEAYMKSGDTIQAISNYEKSLTLDSGNQRAKRMIERMTSKKPD